MILLPSSRPRVLGQVLGVILLFAKSVLAIENPPASLKGIQIPETPGLFSGLSPIVADRTAAIELGKALFWDVAVGSDGIACGTCHFHAGADRRTRNQLDPGTRHRGSASSSRFEPLPDGRSAAANLELRAGDFPLFRLENPLDIHSKVLYSTDDVVSSSGTFLAEFQSIDGATPNEEHCAARKDLVFHQGEFNVRRASTRNAPTIFNAAFNYRNFWDGRANNRFNGQSAYGDRDPEAGVWVLRKGRVVSERISLANASLASQAVAPPLDDREMSCQKRTLMDLGRKLLSRRPLERQTIHSEDSVLAHHRHPSGQGLTLTYADLVRAAFDRRFWSGQGEFGSASNGQAFSQIEANFGFFFGLAIQIYESTLISDDTRFDGPRDRSGTPLAYNEAERRGLRLFVSECMLCHLGPTFSAAAHPKVYSAPNAPQRLIDRRVINGDFDGVGVAYALIDIGYTNTSVTPTEHDVGVGGSDPYGNPLAFSEQFLESMKHPSQPLVDPVELLSCYFTTGYTEDFKTEELIMDPRGRPACRNYARTSKVPNPTVVAEELQKLEQGRLLTATQGAFKIPGLRNVELTGPYMHNGSLKSLEEVLAFYDRGGNFSNPHHIANLVFPRPFSPEEKNDLLAFLRSLTDERVRFERAPFDHPAIDVPNGHGQGGVEGEAFRAQDEWLRIPAVGRNGREGDLGPLKPFASYLVP